MTYAMDDDRWGLHHIETAARGIIDAGLGQGSSLIEPDVPAWSVERAVDLRRRLVDNADAGAGSFLDKLYGQLGGAPRGTYLLAAELLALHVLPLGNVGADTKLNRVTKVVSWLDPPAELPDSLRQALGSPGVFNGGIGFNVQVWKQLSWLLSFIEHWHGLSAQDRKAALDNPWEFRKIVEANETGQLAIRNSLLYLAFPRVFLPIVSQSDKVAIRDTFADVIGGSSGKDSISIDRDLEAISTRQIHELGDVVNYYHEPYRSQWRKRKSDDEAVRAWLVRPRTGGHALVTRWLKEGFVSLAATHLGELDPEVGREELSKAVERGYQHLDYAQRLRLTGEYHQFLSTMKPDDVVLTLTDDEVYVGVIADAPEFTDDTEARLQRPVTWTARCVGSTVDMPAPLPAEIEKQGTIVDITGATDVVQALLDPGKSPDTVEPSGPPMFTQVTGEFANQLHLDTSWLQEIADVLQDQQQIVLYGPPGTGKTFTARALARHLTDTDAVELVQFHPSYAYEDFFEGFRPQQDGASVSFTLTPGPLRRLAAEARDDPSRAYILIIDEINRANLAKVFGELYFLLEYRDESITLQYSPSESFILPPNIFFIGTMNTADRSIALVDAAMRRRFAFVELHPCEPPVRDLLPNWLAAHGKDIERAELLAALNAEIGTEDRDFQIGPSYLMKAEAERDRGLDRIWQYSLLPLLEEHYYGRLTRNQVHARFGLDAIRRAARRVRTPVDGDE